MCIWFFLGAWWSKDWRVAGSNLQFWKFEIHDILNDGGHMTKVTWHRCWQTDWRQCCDILGEAKWRWLTRRPAANQRTASFRVGKEKSREPTEEPSSEGLDSWNRADALDASPSSPRPFSQGWHWLRLLPGDVTISVYGFRVWSKSVLTVQVLLGGSS